MIVGEGMSGVTPLKQALVALLIGLCGIGMAKLWGAGGGIEFAGAFVGILLYVLMNVMISISHANFWKYISPSFGFYVLLMAILIISAKLTSGFSIFAFKEYQMLVLAFTLFYLLASGLSRLIRALFEFANENG